ncbi:hypothetical protein [Corynebacterium atypicum]|uniref:hypothetical protein n=1 Tax=Corynebacterium atypicum TaxID=191610 RepID=UPI000B234118|nr:hypothetical protein [Corynebacterium atypicum]
MAGRHRGDDSRPGIARWLWVTVLVVVLAVVAVAGWFFVRDSSQSSRAAKAKQCIQGELELPVAEAFPGASASAIAAYQDSHPVVRDFCIKPKLVGLDQAAVFVAVDSPAADASLADAGRQRSATKARGVDKQAVGLVGEKKPDIDFTPAAEADFPQHPTPDASVAAAAVLGKSDAAAAELLEHGKGKTATEKPARPAATFESVVKDKARFAPIPNTFAVVSGIPLKPEGGFAKASAAQTEEVERAAADFVESAAARFAHKGKVDASAKGLLLPRQSENAPLYQALGVAPAASAEPPAAPGDTRAAGTTDTLFLIDASQPAADFLKAAPEAVGGAAERVAGSHQVSLWNYSSPLNPGVVNPWRANTDFGGAEEVDDVLGQLAAGGVPMTRTSVVAAADAAAKQAGETGQPVRLVVVTSGTDSEDMSTEEFTDKLQAAIAGQAVEIAVVHAGTGAPDAALTAAADANAEAKEPADLAGAVAKAAGL